MELVYVTHENPIGRQAPYYIARVDLAYCGLRDQVEQLWLNDVGNGTFEVACVPFCAYGVSYGDRVSLDSSGEYVKSIVEKSSNRVLRVLIAPVLASADSTNIRTGLEAIASDLGIDGERHGERFNAFNITPDTDPAILLERVKRESERGAVYWEWGDLLAFSGGE